MTPQTLPYEHLTRHWQHARQAFETGDAATCLSNLDALIGHCGHLPDWKVLQGQALLAIGQPEAALTAIGEGLAAQPRCGPLWATAAVAWVNLRRWSCAETCLDLARKLDQELPGLTDFAAKIAVQEPETEGIDLPDAWQAWVTASQRPPTLGACLIVRDESANLAGCLASLAGFDEIVVLDTGSTDDTVAIAEASGAKIGHATWTDDFAAARNASLAMATTDWILIIDADERLTGNHTDVRRSIDAHGYAGLVLCPVIDNEDPEEGHATYHRGARLAARTPGRHFVGRIHEQLCNADGQQPLNWQVDPWRLLHTGYARTVRLSRGKSNRNQRLLDLWLAESPEMPEPHYYTGLELRSVGRPADAIALFRTAAALSPPVHLRSMIHLQLLGALSETGDHAGILGLVPQTSADCEHLPDYWLYLGSAYANLGRFHEAETAYRRAIAMPETAIGALESRGARTWRPFVCLAELQGLRGDWAGALALLTPRLAEAGLLPSFHQLYVRALLATDRPSDAAAHCADLLADATLSPRLVRELAAALAHHGPDGAALLARFGDWPAGVALAAERLRDAANWQGIAELEARWRSLGLAGLDALAGIAHHHLGDKMAAQAAFERAVSRDPSLTEPWHNLGSLALGRGELDLAEQCLRQALQRDATSLMTLLDLAKVAHGRGDHGQVRQWFYQAQSLAPDHPQVLRMQTAIAALR